MTSMVIENIFNYQKIGTEFLQKYYNMIGININFTDCFYEVGTLCTIRLVQGQKVEFYEMTGYQAFHDRMSKMNITSIKIQNPSLSSQPYPRDKDSILITSQGMAEIGQTKCTIFLTFLIHGDQMIQKISNQIMEIYL